MRAVIFDLGNVLVTFDGQATVTEMARLTPLAPDQLFTILRNLDHDFGTGQIDGRSYYQHLVTHAGLTADYDTFVAAFTSSQARIEPGIAFAVALAQRPFVRIAAISNTNDIHTTWMQQHLPEFAHFDPVIFSQEAGLLKPDPAIYRLALAQLGIPAAQAIFIDDIAANVAAAQALGMAGIVHSDWQQTRPAVEKWLAADD